MALNSNKSEENCSNANGISSNANNASKQAVISCIAASEPDNGSPVISFTGKLPHICYSQVTSAYEVIDLYDSSSEDEDEDEDEEEEEEADAEEEEEPDMDLSLKLRQEEVKELSSSSVSSTDGQIQGEAEEKILILLGCVNCLRYVLVSQDYPSCPTCRSISHFVDVTSGKPYKKQKLE